MIDISKKQKDTRDTIKAMLDAQDKGEVHEVMAVTFDAAGNPSFYYSGNWHSLAKASVFLQSEFMKHAWESE